MPKPTHGSDSVQGGLLRGATDATDYFYFFCPKCPDDQLVRVLGYTVVSDEPGNRYDAECKRKAKRSFSLKFHLNCDSCGFDDIVKISNTGWQGGKHAATLTDQIQKPA